MISRKQQGFKSSWRRHINQVIFRFDVRMDGIAGYANEASALSGLADDLLSLFPDFFDGPGHQTEHTGYVTAQADPISEFRLGIADVHAAHGVDGMKAVDSSFDDHITDEPDISIGMLDAGNVQSVGVGYKLIQQSGKEPFRKKSLQAIGFSVIARSPLTQKISAPASSKFFM